jgi:hypothetical protein
MKRTLETLAAALLLLGGAVAVAQDKKDPAPAPAKQDTGKKEDLEATLVSLKGTVDVKRPEDKDWVPAERNMKLKKGSEICTAVASTAKLLFTGNIQVDVKALTQAKIEDLAKAGGKVNADVNLKFGSIEVDIQKGDLRADMKVTAPNSTTSVSGSHGFVHAPASGGGGHITLRTFTGTWNHHLPGPDTDQGINGDGVANDQGDSALDLNYRFLTDLFLNFFGKDGDELFQGHFTHKAGDPNPWDVPLAEFGGTGPGGPRTRKPGALPFPPGHP